jgi:phage FluMu protein Com
MTMKTCDRCAGTKKFNGMGFMKEDCPLCKGIGKVLVKTADPAPVESNKDKIKRMAFKKAASDE